jgi:hypothetical protein
MPVAIAVTSVAASASVASVVSVIDHFPSTRREPVLGKVLTEELPLERNNGCLIALEPLVRDKNSRTRIGIFANQCPNGANNRLAG